MNRTGDEVIRQSETVYKQYLLAFSEWHVLIRLKKYNKVTHHLHISNRHSRKAFVRQNSEESCDHVARNDMRPLDFLNLNTLALRVAIEKRYRCCHILAVLDMIKERKKMFYENHHRYHCSLGKRTITDRGICSQL
ncbi:Hypothetical predicted protein [Octopus vulgaris]|uniref:Uncharacterized protein n=1 Tax=Octopus vulgaris TaxID=6645 RepID=A0AA36BMR2_OCTVU|nr:Hypothetical predicted protein [Octopus vulgaris]